jgi:D-serine dehydratase
MQRSRITALHDHHASVALAEGESLDVGDVVGARVVHSCTTFDRWPVIPVVDKDHRVVSIERTLF